MHIHDLANQLRKRLLERRLAPLDVLSRISDATIIDSYITCSCCGERQIKDPAVLARLIEQAESADAFLELCNVRRRASAPGARSHQPTAPIFRQQDAQRSYPTG